MLCGCVDANVEVEFDLFRFFLLGADGGRVGAGNGGKGTTTCPDESFTEQSELNSVSEIHGFAM